jgi:hypothetical protein
LRFIRTTLTVLVVRGNPLWLLWQCWRERSAWRWGEAR